MKPGVFDPAGNIFEDDVDDGFDTNADELVISNELLLEYLKSRRQFGRHIGSYQSLKHPTVDILIGLERSRSLLYRAATLVGGADDEPAAVKDREIAAEDREIAAEDREIALRMAKAESTKSFVFAADRAIQFHGGVGFTWECDVQIWFKRIMFDRLWLGAPELHRERFARIEGW